MDLILIGKRALAVLLGILLGSAAPLGAQTPIVITLTGQSMIRSDLRASDSAVFSPRLPAVGLAEHCNFVRRGPVAEVRGKLASPNSPLGICVGQPCFLSSFRKLAAGSGFHFAIVILRAGMESAQQAG